MKAIILLDGYLEHMTLTEYAKRIWRGQPAVWGDYLGNNMIAFLSDEKIFEEKEFVLASRYSQEQVRGIVAPSMKINGYGKAAIGMMESHYLTGPFVFNPEYIGSKMIWEHAIRLSPDLRVICSKDTAESYNILIEFRNQFSGRYPGDPIMTESLEKVKEILKRKG